MSERRCAFRDDDDGTSCDHVESVHQRLSHPMPGGPDIGTCLECAYTGAYTHYFVPATPPESDLPTYHYTSVTDPQTGKQKPYMPVRMVADYATPPASEHDDEYTALARQMHASITEGQTVAETAIALRILGTPDRRALFDAGRATGTVEGWADYTSATPSASETVEAARPPDGGQRVQCAICHRWPLASNWPNHMQSQGDHWPTWPPIRSDSDKRVVALREAATVALDNEEMTAAEFAAKYGEDALNDYLYVAKRLRAALSDAAPEDAA